MLSLSKVKSKVRFALNAHNYIYNKLVFRFNFVKVCSYYIGGRIYIQNKNKISIGKNFKASSGGGKFNQIGGDTILRLITTKHGCIEIGDNVGISNSTIYSKQKIIIGDNVLIGGGCKIWDTNFHSIDYRLRGTSSDQAESRSIIIEKNCFIGGGSIILKGVVIGENSIIGAGSVVRTSISKNEIWAGNPAKFIRSL